MIEATAQQATNNTKQQHGKKLQELKVFLQIAQDIISEVDLATADISMTTAA